ncbi:AraC family transcriptional regulator [Solibaculum mannosilyticum]
MSEMFLTGEGFPPPLAESGGCRVFQFHSDSGEGMMTQYDLFPGVFLMYNDFHMEGYDSVFCTAEDLLCIDYCRQGRMEYQSGPDTFSYVEAGDMKLDRRLEHRGHFTFPLAHYHGLTIGFVLPQAEQALREWVREFPVDLSRLQKKFCSGRHPKVIHRASSTDHIFQELYAVPEQIKLPYFRIKVLELLLYLNALELGRETEKPYFYKSQVEKVKAAHRLLTEDLERHYTIAELSERFSIPATALKECFKSIYGQPINTYMRCFRMDQAGLLLRQEVQTSVAEIAGLVGYDSASKFAAAFREVKGKTPLEYRREGQ